MIISWNVCVYHVYCMYGCVYIGIPAAIRLSGFVPGVILLVLVAVVTNYTVLLLIKNGIISGKYSYQVQIT